MSTLAERVDFRTQGAAIPPFPVLRLTVEQYHAMIRAGILAEENRVELLDGWLMEKMTKNRPHSLATEMVRRAMEKVLPPGWHFESQEPITLATSEPEPDGMVLRGELQQYRDHPGPQDTALVIEVADASLEYDETLKKTAYAEARIPIYWIVNLLDRRVEVYEEPSGPVQHPSYRRRRDYAIDEDVPVVLDGVEIGRVPARELMPQGTADQ